MKSKITRWAPLVLAFIAYTNDLLEQGKRYYTYKIEDIAFIAIFNALLHAAYIFVITYLIIRLVLWLGGKISSSLSKASARYRESSKDHHTEP